MSGALALFWGPLTDFGAPTLISVTYYRKWIRVRCRVMFSVHWAPERTWIKRSGENSDILGPRNAFLGFWAPERRSGAFRLTFITDTVSDTVCATLRDTAVVRMLKSCVLTRHDAYWHVVRVVRAERNMTRDVAQRRARMWVPLYTKRNIT